MKSTVPILVFCLLTLFGYSEIFASPLDSAKGTKKRGTSYPATYPKSA